MISMGILSELDPSQAAVLSEVWTKLKAVPTHWTLQERLEYQSKLSQKLKSAGM